MSWEMQMRLLSKMDDADSFYTLFQITAMHSRAPPADRTREIFSRWPGNFSEDARTDQKTTRVIT